MNVKLISVSEPKIGLYIGGTSVSPAEALIVYIARVSSNREDENKTEELEKLISYLIRNKHWSPFEMGSMCVEITTSRAISLQIVRHRSFSYQQFSQRYAESADMEPVELRMQADKNRQSSTEIIDPEIGAVPASELIDQHLRRSQQLYRELLEVGVAKETARFILPSTTQTRLYMHGTVRSWIHYLQIRDDEHAQLEHQRIAQEIKKIFINQFPLTSGALGWK